MCIFTQLVSVLLVQNQMQMIFGEPQQLLKRERPRDHTRASRSSNSSSVAAGSKSFF